MTLPATSLYAALLGIIGVVLWAMVGPARRRANVSLGDGGDAALIEAVRRHMNWVESVPFIVLLFALIEINGGSRTWLHVLGATLVVARIIHPFGISAGVSAKWQRMVGAGVTFLIMIAAVATLAWQSFGALLRG